MPKAISNKEYGENYRIIAFLWLYAAVVFKALSENAKAIDIVSYYIIIMHIHTHISSCRLARVAQVYRYIQAVTLIVIVNLQHLPSVEWVA